MGGKGVLLGPLHNMNWNVANHQYFGESLFADNGCVQVIIPLTYGLRIGHLSLCGGENLFFEQPKDMKELATEAGWRVRGGHRLWLAPESEKVYCPDNEPITFEIQGEEIVLRQKEDPWLKVKKTMRLSFVEENAVRVVNEIENTDKETLRCSLWAISAMAPGGTQNLGFALRDGGMDHWHRISMWDYTSLGDPRVEYRRDGICLKHRPTGQKYKIGVGHPYGPVTYENKGVIFEKHFPVELEKEYPDANVSYETFMCDHMVEMESLSPLKEILPGETAQHTEVWKLRRA